MHHSCKINSTNLITYSAGIIQPECTAVSQNLQKFTNSTAKHNVQVNLLMMTPCSLKILIPLLPEKYFMEITQNSNKHS